MDSDAVSYAPSISSKSRMSRFCRSVAPKTDETDELTRICVPLREELTALREELFKIQEDEKTTLNEYLQTEILLQRTLNQMKSKQKKDATIDSKFDELIKQFKHNQSLREQIVSTDHHIFYKISDAQKKASDARFIFDTDRILAKSIRDELDALKTKSSQLDGILDSIRAEYIGLTITEKDLEDDKNRLQKQLDEQQRIFDELTEPYVLLRQRFETLSTERKGRERALQKKLTRAEEIRDQKKEYIAQVKKDQDVVREKITKLEHTVSDLTDKRDRMNTEIAHLLETSHRHKEQIAALQDMLK